MTKEQAVQAFETCMNWKPGIGCESCPLYARDQKSLSKECLAVGMATLFLEDVIEDKPAKECLLCGR